MRIVTLSIAVVLLGVPAAVSSEPATVESTTQKLYAVTASAFERISKDIFLRTMQQQAFLGIDKYKTITFRAVDDARPGARALRSGDSMIVEYNLGTTAIIYYYAEYAVILNNDLLYNENCLNYMSDFVKKISGQPLISVSDFLDAFPRPAIFCGVPQLDSRADIRKQQQSIFIETLIPTVAIMLGHEVAHHLLNHFDRRRPSPEKSRQFEADADLFASNLLWHWGPRAPSAIIFDYLMKAQKSHPFSHNARHDIAACRFVYFLLDDRRFFDEASYELIVAKIRSRKDMMHSLSEAVAILNNYAKGGPTAKCVNTPVYYGIQGP